jgi:hypothetical protein
MGDAATAGSLTAWNDHTLDECRWCPARTSFATSCTPLAYYYPTLDFSALSDKVPSVNPSGNQEHGHRTPTLSHWRMPLLFLVLALLRGLVYAAVIPPWQSPDEHGHFEYAWLISQHGPFVGPESISPEFQQRVLESMARYDFWRLVHQPTPEALPSGFTDPSDHILSLSRPQVGDERPLYYLLAGGLLWLTGVQDVVVGMYTGRLVSVLLYATAVGLTALTTRRLFPQSPFLQTVPPGLVLFLPMLGQMVSAVNSDAMGVLTSTLFLASLIPVFRDGATWRRGAVVIVALVLALLSKKTTLFLIPTTVLALPAYMWIRGFRCSRPIRVGLIASIATLTLAGIVLSLMPGDDATGWTEWTGSCGATRVEGDAYKGKATLRAGACADEIVAQALLPETVRRLSGKQVSLKGWTRSTAGRAVGQISVWDSEGHSQMTIAAEGKWQPFTLTHVVDKQARWIGVRLTWIESGEGLLFDDLTLSTEDEENFLVNGSAEMKESLLVDLLSRIACSVGAPRRLVERVLRPESWSLEAWQEYAQAALFCFHSFWGLFGLQAIPLPRLWYWVIELTFLLALAGSAIFVAKNPGRERYTSYLIVLMGGCLLLVLQTLLPMIVNRGTYWLPQGRYLFPGIFAIVVLMVRGLYQLLPRSWEAWVTFAVVGSMVGFDMACLGLLIIPYFYS